jgi:hypothetical protein
MPSAEVRSPIEALRCGPPWWLHGVLLLAAVLLLGLAFAFLYPISDEFRAPGGSSSPPKPGPVESPS